MGVIKDVTERRCSQGLYYFSFLSSAPPRFQQTPSNTTADETENAMLLCSTSIPDTTITWYKDGKVVSGDNFAKTSRGLLIVRVYREDRGWYVCNATNRAGTRLAHAYLNVVRPLEAG